MAIKKQSEVYVKPKIHHKKIVVTQGWGPPFSGEKIPYKVLYTEKLQGDNKDAEARVAQLKEEYADVKALSICYFSI